MTTTSGTQSYYSETNVEEGGGYGERAHGNYFTTQTSDSYTTWEEESLKHFGRSSGRSATSGSNSSREVSGSYSDEKTNEDVTKDERSTFSESGSFIERYSTTESSSRRDEESTKFGVEQNSRTVFHDQCTATTESGNCTRTGQIFSLAEIEQAIRIELGLSSTDIITSVDLTSEGRSGSGKVNGMSVSYDLDNLPPAAQPETPSSRSRGQGGGFNPGFWSGLYAGAVGLANTAVTVGTFGFANLDAAEDAAFADAGINNNIRGARNAVAETAAGSIPGVGELQDVNTLFAADSSFADRALSFGSLGLNALTAGFAPNFGGAAKAARELVEGAGRNADNVAGLASQAARNADEVGQVGKFGKTTRVKTAPVDVEVPKAPVKPDADGQLPILNNTQCFAPETLVATPDGQRPISEIRKSDAVLAYDHRNGEWREQQVEKFHENLYEGPLHTIHTDSGAIRTTIYHPFWVLNGRDLDERSAPRELEEKEDEGLSLPGRWVNSHELRCGDILIGQDGKRRTVQRIEEEFVSGFLVHNLTISEDHTFAVGVDAILVHNTGGCGGKIPNDDLLGPPPKRGNAPIGEDGHPIELHHRDQTPDGPLDEMTRTDHRLGENFKKNHANTGQDESLIDRNEWKQQQRQYWRDEYDSGRFDDFD